MLHLRMLPAQKNKALTCFQRTATVNGIKKSKVLFGDSPGGEDARDSGAHDAAALPGAVARHKDAVDIRFQVFIRDKVRVEKFDFRCVQQSGWVQNAGHDFIDFFQGLP